MEKNNYFFSMVEKNAQNQAFIDVLERWSLDKKKQVYIINKPLGDNSYNYNNHNAIVVLIPKRKICFIDFSGHGQTFEYFVEDFTSDLISLSDKYKYKEIIGRPREWRDDLFKSIQKGSSLSLDDFITHSRIKDTSKERIGELLISLLIGSINDPGSVGIDEPPTLLDKVKKKILLFDGQQMSFVHEIPNKKIVRIQGLSGAGKTELLLHKLKDSYIKDNQTKIVFTCHNRILASDLRNRIPVFFNFMKVDLQIEWDYRLWCIHAWGSAKNANSGVYSLICNKYGLSFRQYSAINTFEAVCKEAIKEIKTNKLVEKYGYTFDITFIDESQDFPDVFFELCGLVTSKNVYIAGDIFQNIFDNFDESQASPDYLLSRCYRTDPRTLMFAHALGMGLFEEERLNWLNNNEWENCGYTVDSENGILKLTRDPIRRFEDTEELPDFNSVLIYESEDKTPNSIASKVIDIIQEIQTIHKTVTAEDIGIIILDKNSKVYLIADYIALNIQNKLGWTANIAYESKTKTKDALFISNRNNVKGLEFPFVICVTFAILDSLSYRNTSYMALTRSFLQSYLVLPKPKDHNLLTTLQAKLSELNKNNFIEVAIPNNEEKQRIQSRKKLLTITEIYEEFINGICDELGIDLAEREKVINKFKDTAESFGTTQRGRYLEMVRTYYETVKGNNDQL